MTKCECGAPTTNISFSTFKSGANKLEPSAKRLSLKMRVWCAHHINPFPFLHLPFLALLLYS